CPRLYGRVESRLSLEHEPSTALACRRRRLGTRSRWLRDRRLQWPLVGPRGAPLRRVTAGPLGGGTHLASTAAMRTFNNTFVKSLTPIAISPWNEQWKDALLQHASSRAGACRSLTDRGAQTAFKLARTDAGNPAFARPMNRVA